jgi:hypothetical protein
MLQVNRLKQVSNLLASQLRVFFINVLMLIVFDIRRNLKSDLMKMKNSRNGRTLVSSNFKPINLIL